MRILITKSFSKWAKKESVSLSSLKEAAQEIIEGQVEANLGVHLFKKRIALNNRGKSSGARTIVFYLENDKIIFVHGFLKNEKSNLSPKELELFKKLSDVLINMTKAQYNLAIEKGNFKEITYEKFS